MATTATMEKMEIMEITEIMVIMEKMVITEIMAKTAQLLSQIGLKPNLSLLYI
jgi:hypothetical protein